MPRATGLATPGRDAQGGLKRRRPEFGEFIAVKKEEGGPSAALSPLEEKGDMGRVGGKPRAVSIRRPWFRPAATTGRRCVRRDGGSWRR